jgi:fumarylpyruvate hydrolase
MTHAFVLPERPAVSITGSDATFPIRRIFCIGRNYAAHAREMGKDPNRELPFFFTKFPDAAVPGGGKIPYPSQTDNYHYEAELVIAIGKEGAEISHAAALDLVFGYAVGLDMTRRDLQLEARDKGRPWDTGKNFAFSAPIGPIRPVSTSGHVSSGRIHLIVNGVTRQDADIADLIWDCAETIAYISRFQRLLPGDLIYTGTPAGVGPVLPGDVIEVTIAGLESLTVTIGPIDAAFRVRC